MTDPQGRRFTEEEFRRILEIASTAPPRRQAADPMQGGEGQGFSLDEIVDIARAVGIDPIAVNDAAAGLARTPVATRFGRRRWPPELEAELHLPEGLTPEQVRGVLEEVERIAGFAGTVMRTDRGMEWRAGGPGRPARENVTVEVARRAGADATVLVTVHQAGKRIVGGAFALLMGAIVGAFVAQFSVFVAVPVGIASAVGIGWLHALGTRATHRGLIVGLAEGLREFLQEG